MIQIRPVHPMVGAEISGVDLTKPLDDATFAEIRAAFARYSVLVFHDQPVDDEQQMAFSRRFGPLEVTKVGSRGAGGHLAYITNLDESGKRVPLGHRAILNLKANSLWHTDSSFKKVPAMASALTGRIVPPEGAETEYLSTRAVWRELPEATKRRIDGLVAWHSYFNSRRQIDPEMMTAAEHQAVPPVKQVLVRTHPDTGEKALYIASHASHIEGWPEAEGRKLLADLMEFATDRRFVYTHRWRQHDLVIWDNRCTMHRGRPFDYERYDRYMIRTTIAGDGPTVEQ
jgi:alpha-ketoglutarate-dependent 2,4-dichlorophenoxyacetate dioxygenase